MGPPGDATCGESSSEISKFVASGGDSWGVFIPKCKHASSKTLILTIQPVAKSYLRAAVSCIDSSVWGGSLSSVAAVSDRCGDLVITSINSNVFSENVMAFSRSFLFWISRRSSAGNSSSTQSAACVTIFYGCPTPSMWTQRRFMRQIQLKANLPRRWDNSCTLG